jgi:hypothetical protein
MAFAVFCVSSQWSKHHMNMYEFGKRPIFVQKYGYYTRLVSNYIIKKGLMYRREHPFLTFSNHFSTLLKSYSKWSNMEWISTGESDQGTVEAW